METNLNVKVTAEQRLQELIDKGIIKPSAKMKVNEDGDSYVEAKDVNIKGYDWPEFLIAIKTI